MASDDIAQLADALAKTHVEDGELSFKDQGLKLDSAGSGQRVVPAKVYCWIGWAGPCLWISHLVTCAFSGGAGPWDRAVPVSESPVSRGQHCGSGCSPGHRQGSGEQRPAPGTPQFIVKVKRHTKLWSGPLLFFWALFNPCDLQMFHKSWFWPLIHPTGHMQA